MNPPSNYLEVNKSSWNKRTELHVDSAFYDVQSFKEGKSSLNDIELKLLGSLEGKSVLHLQCHFGMDTLSMARMGAEVTGMDLSDKAIDKARELAEELELNARFICCDVYDLPQHLDEQFDVVFTSYGTIGWLPDIDRWAEVVAHFLKPGGQFVFAEFHPVVWMFDNDFETIFYPYFKAAAIVESESGSYGAPDAKEQIDSITWNHGLAEVITPLLQKGLRLTAFEEYDYSPYNCFRNTIEVSPGKFQIRGLEGKIPMVYALSGVLS
ncbi:MAG: class I SAM-dependent methyltransferase [Saprospiraceae bacterium]|nr:class I SAM-dependent methyltransferase [Saprospiraceae bacterium]